MPTDADKCIKKWRYIAMFSSIVTLLTLTLFIFFAVSTNNFSTGYLYVLNNKGINCSTGTSGTTSILQSLSTVSATGTATIS